MIKCYLLISLLSVPIIGQNKTANKTLENERKNNQTTNINKNTDENDKTGIINSITTNVWRGVDGIWESVHHQLDKSKTFIGSTWKALSDYISAKK
ncbi:Solute carrier organic anion transporter family member 1B1 [Dirofilaria immitis]